MAGFAPYLDAWLARTRRAAEGEQAAARAVRARLPEAVRSLVDEFGASRVVLFGSLGTGRLSEDSDVDLGVLGIPPAQYFEAVARVAEILGRDVDLVELEKARPSLARHIEDTGEVLHGLPR